MIDVSIVTINVAATGKPAIGGTLRVGETLTADTSAIADPNDIPDGAFTYQWVSSDGTTDTDIPNATGSTYILASSDLGKTVKVRVVFNDSAGYVETVTSGATAKVKVRAVEIWAATLTLGQDSLNDDLGYGRFLSGGDLSDTTIMHRSNTYTVKTLSLVENIVGTFTLNFVLETSVTEEYVETWILIIGGEDFDTSDSIVTPSPNKNFRWGISNPSWSKGNMIDVSIRMSNSATTGEPVIAGTPRVGETLTADTSDIDDANGISDGAFTYQWLRVNVTTDADIPNATGSTYTLTPSDLGKTVKVKVAFSDGHVFEEAVISDATEAVGQSYGVRV